MVKSSDGYVNLWIRVFVFLLALKPGVISFLKQENSYLPGHVLLTVRVSVGVQCETLCVYTSLCVSINYCVTKNLCELNAVRDNVRLRTQPGWVYSDVGNKEKPDGCRVCNPGGTCIPLSNKKYICATTLSGLSDVTKETCVSDNTSSVGVSTSSAAILTSTTAVWSSSRTVLGQSLSGFEDGTGSLLSKSTPSTMLAPSLPERSKTFAIFPAMDATFNPSSQIQGSELTPPLTEIPCTDLSVGVDRSVLSTVLEVITTSTLTSESLLMTRRAEINDNLTTTSSTTESTSTKITTTTKHPPFAVVVATPEPATTTQSYFSRIMATRRFKRQKVMLQRKYRKHFACPNFQLPFEEKPCGDPNMVRRDKQPCRCKTGLHPTFPYSNTCQRECKEYGQRMVLQSRLFCIEGHNDATYDAFSPSECQRRCLRENDFLCRSFDFWKGKCWLSKSTRADVTSSWMPYCGCLYFQRTCKK